MKKIIRRLAVMLASVAVSNLTIAWELQTNVLKRSDGSAITYYLDHNESLESRSLLLVIQGSDCNSIARHPSIEQYVAVAPEHSVLLVEKYGITNDLTWAMMEGGQTVPLITLETTHWSKELPTIPK